MGVMDSYQKYLKENARLQELTKLRNESYKIIQYQNFYPLEYMNEVISDLWYNLYTMLNMSSAYYKVKESFGKLHSGHINRKQFAEIANADFEKINKVIDYVADSVKKAYNEFSTAYDLFFSNGALKEEDFGKKLIYLALSQPVSKEIIMEFLEL